ncbi:MAG TPA: ATP-binding cassette domain-containing protein [Microthrixaceae bacterium]|nr:ATP-binding cassette domain-containing protein [Microthrixaceae bacterium]
MDRTLFFMINVQSLTKRYGDTVAVDDLTFNVRPGTVTGFLGPNGAGKSTTMRMILGLDRPSGGTALIEGRPLSGHPAPLAAIGSLLDASALHPRRSAYDHLWSLAATNGIPRSRVDVVLDVVGLTEVAHRSGGGFSLGMGQRLGIAAALLGDPPVIMLDEPVNGLDPEGIQWIRQLLRGLADEGRTVFVSSHLMGEMELMAEHFVIIGRGRLVADISAVDLRSTTRPERVTVCSHDLTDLVDELRCEGVTISSKEPGAIDVEGRTAEEIGRLALDAGIALTALIPQQPSLEDIFMTLTADSVEYHGSDDFVGVA